MADSLSLEVPEHLDGDRLDKALAVLLDVSRSQARALVEDGVLLDGVPGRAADRVRAGNVVIAPSPESALALEPERIEFAVIHEDAHLIVVDKPPGLVVHPGAGRRRRTLAAGLLERYPDLEGVGAPGRWGIVHRLDRDTSGVLLVARTQDAYEKLTRDLARRRIGRIYTALVHGTFAIQTGTIDAPLGRDPFRPTRRAVITGGKAAITHYEVVDEYPEAALTLLDIRLETGRTHQIRVHMAAIGHPIVGDRTYTNLTSPVATPRVFLHARRVDLLHPASGEPVFYEATIPKDLVGILEALTEMRPG